MIGVARMPRSPVLFPVISLTGWRIDRRDLARRLALDCRDVVPGRRARSLCLRAELRQRYLRCRDIACLNMWSLLFSPTGASPLSGEPDGSLDSVGGSRNVTSG